MKKMIYCEFSTYYTLILKYKYNSSPEMSINRILPLIQIIKPF